MRDKKQIAEAFKHGMQGLEKPEILKCFESTLWFAERYASTCELRGPIYLVLDNSLIQAFKHRHTQKNRAPFALAFETFCGFVRHWSDRETHLAVSPMAIYEHLGRRLPVSVAAVEGILVELQQLLDCTGLRIALLRAETPTHLFKRLQEIVKDEAFLTRFVEGIDKANWRIDLRAPLGVKIPISEAWRSLPEDLPLRYFDPWYVRFVLSARIERHILRQCQGHGPTPIDSGPLSKTLAGLNTFSRNGLLTGLGDIDLLQICDVSRQYQQAAGYVLAGQTLDHDLASALSQRHVFSVRAGVEGGDPQREQRIKEMVELMVGRPFAEETARGQHIREQWVDFARHLADACQQAWPHPP